MTDPASLTPPARTAADHALALVRGAISAVPIAGGVGAEIFAMVVRAPYDRRSAEWMRDVGERLHALSLTDEQRFKALLDDEAFTSVLIAATQGAMRAHRREKILLLAHAVEQSARAIDISADMQLVFLRFVDELTMTHIALLRMLRARAREVAAVQTYGALHGLFLTDSGAECSPEEFQLFCNDLAARVLARFSESLDPFPGVAETNTLVTEDSGQGIMVLITDLGRGFLGFVGDDDASRNTPANIA